MCPAANIFMYEIMYDFDNIREAYRLARRCKANSIDVSEFDLNRIYNRRKLQKQLREKRWEEIFNYYRFYISEPKIRKVDALKFDGRVAQHVLCDNIIKPYMEPRLVKENCACREGKGTDYARNLIKQGLVKFLKHHKTGYVLKIDVKKYFDSIDHDVLKEMISNFPDKEVSEFICYIIDHVPEPVGLPLGNQTSQWMALYYLDPLDRIIKEKYRIRVYARYMDDFIIIHESKEYLQRLLLDLREYAQDKLKLQFNSKTQITPLKKGFVFLGWKFKITETGGVKLYIEKGKAKEKRRKLRVLETEYKKGLITNEKLEERIVAHCAHLKHGCTYYFIRKRVMPIKSYISVQKSEEK